MMKRALLLAVLLVAHAEAGVGLAVGSSSVAFALFPQASVPLRLSAGPDGATVIGANETSARSSVSGGILVSTVHDTATLTNQLATAQRVRMSLVTATGSGLAECVECTVQLRNGATHSTQLNYVNGAPSATQGAWVTLAPTGQAGASWTIHAVARASAVADKLAVIDYQLESVPPAATSPSLVLFGMRMTFTV